MKRLVFFALLIGLSLVAAPGVNAGLLCQTAHDCCCTHHGTAPSGSGCRMNCSDQSAAERFSAVNPRADSIRLWPEIQLESFTHDALSPADHTTYRLALATTSHSPPPKRYLAACTLRL